MTDILTVRLRQRQSMAQREAAPYGNRRRGNALANRGTMDYVKFLLMAIAYDSDDIRMTGYG